jgi:hypothetical protein
LSHATPSGAYQVLGRIRPAIPARSPRREPLGLAIAKGIAILSGAVLVASLGMLLTSFLLR